MIKYFMIGYNNKRSVKSDSKVNAPGGYSKAVDPFHVEIS